jgi:hypothetical protein
VLLSLKKLRLHILLDFEKEPPNVEFIWNDILRVVKGTLIPIQNYKRV